MTFLSLAKGSAAEKSPTVGINNRVCGVVYSPFEYRTLAARIFSLASGFVVVSRPPPPRPRSGWESRRHGLDRPSRRVPDYPLRTTRSILSPVAPLGFKGQSKNRVTGGGKS